MNVSIAEHLKELAAYAPSPLPVVSLYLNTQPGPNGRANFDSFVRQRFRAVARTFAERSPERESFDSDTRRVRQFLDRELRPSTNGLALFACAGDDGFFDALQLDTPIHRHQLYVGDQPHLYTLARLEEQFRRYVAVVADTNCARLFVFGLNKTLGQGEVNSTKLSRTQVGGWSQARYQRRVKNQHQQHAKEVVDALDRVVRDEGIEHIVLAGDQVIIPLLRSEMPRRLIDKVVGVLPVDIRTPEREILAATLAALQAHDANSDEERVRGLYSDYRAGGLATVGLRGTHDALTNGQVDELLVTAALRDIRDVDEDGEEPLAPFTVDELVTRARQTGAEIRFIEDAELLAPVGGVGAFLRYQLDTATGEE